MSNDDKQLKEYYEYQFDFPNAPTFEDADERQKECVRQSFGFQRYKLACAWLELKEEIRKAVVKVLPKN